MKNVLAFEFIQIFCNICIVLCTYKKTSMFKKELKNSTEIVEFIIEFATDYVDEDMILEYFFDCKAVLKKVPINSIKQGNLTNNSRSKKKEKEYKKLPIETMPPVIVENEVVLDGNHRLRIAKTKNQKNIYIYDLISLNK